MVVSERRPPAKDGTRPLPRTASASTGHPPLKFKLQRSERGLGKSFTAFHYADPIARFELLKSGVPATFFDDVAAEMGRSREWLASVLGLSIATLNRRKSDGKPLSTVDGESVLSMARLIGQAQAMVEESGDPTHFNAAQGLTEWIDSPIPALGGRRPTEYLDTAEGFAIISNLLARIVGGVIS